VNVMMKKRKNCVRLLHHHEYDLNASWRENSILSDSELDLDLDFLMTWLNPLLNWDRPMITLLMGGLRRRQHQIKVDIGQLLFQVRHGAGPNPRKCCVIKNYEAEKASTTSTINQIAYCVLRLAGRRSADVLHTALEGLVVCASKKHLILTLRVQF
jgi:hypothetical protein